MLIIGLTGGIACGKSTVSNYLHQKHKLHIVDLDVISREVVEIDSVRRKIFKEFPGSEGPLPQNSPPDSTPPLDRAALASIIFGNKDKRKKLDALMRWPILMLMIKKIVISYLKGLPCIVIDAPLLFEAGIDKICSLTITVYIDDESKQVERLIERDKKLKLEQQKKKEAEQTQQGKTSSSSSIPSNASAQNASTAPLTEEEAKSRVSAQMPLSIKRQRSTYQLNNSDTVEHLYNDIDQLIAQIKQKHRPWLPRNSLLVYLTTLFFVLLIYVVYKITPP